MTIAAQSSRQAHVGNGLVTDFSFAFRVDDPSWLTVLVGGIPQASGFTVELHADQGTSPGGHVFFTEAPLAGVAVELVRAVPLTQGVDYRTGDGFPAEVHELALDKLTMALQDEVAARLAAQGTTVTPAVDVGLASVTPAGSVLTRTVAEWLARLAVDGGPIPVQAGGGVRRTLAGWIDQLLSEAGGGGIVTPTGNRIGAGTLAERDAITDWTAGDLWFDTADSWHPYRFDGLAWVDIINPYLASRTRTFVQAEAPTNPAGGVPLVEGDLWFDSDNGYSVASWDGLRWVTVRDTGSIDASRLLGTIDLARLADGSIDAAKLAAAMKGDGVNPVAWLAANAIGATHIIANSITAGKLVAGTITARELAAESVVAGKIAAGCITAAHIAAGQVVLPGGVIRSINDSTEGIQIRGDRIDIVGSVTFQTAVAGKADAQAVQDALAAKADANMGNVTAIDGGLIKTGAVQTSDYQEDQSGNPTAGARISMAPGGGPAGKFGPGGIQIGTKLLSQTWMNATEFSAHRMTLTNGLAGSRRDINYLILSATLVDEYTLRLSPVPSDVEVLAVGHIRQAWGSYVVGIPLVVGGRSNAAGYLDLSFQAAGYGAPVAINVGTWALTLHLQWLKTSF